jgi:hypothetical protein
VTALLTGKRARAQPYAADGKTPGLDDAHRPRCVRCHLCAVGLARASLSRRTARTLRRDKGDFNFRRVSGELSRYCFWHRRLLGCTCRYHLSPRRFVVWKSLDGRRRQPTYQPISIWLRGPCGPPSAHQHGRCLQPKLDKFFCGGTRGDRGQHPIGALGFGHVMHPVKLTVTRQCLWRDGDQATMSQRKPSWPVNIARFRK